MVRWIWGDAAAMAKLDNRQLRDLGRLAYPMLRRKGEKGFSRISWTEALDLAGDKLRAADPKRVAFFLTARGITNEVYYAGQKAARFLGTSHIDNAARICHSPSAYALRDGLGVTAATCSYTDLIGSDLVVFIGANPANNQPVTMKYLLAARRADMLAQQLAEPAQEAAHVHGTVGAIGAFGLLLPAQSTPASPRTPRLRNRKRLRRTSGPCAS